MIVGGSGYGGSELLRILLSHPNVDIQAVTANEQAGRQVSEVHLNLRRLTDLKFVEMPTDAEHFDGVDVVFLALPHGHALQIVPKLPRHLKVIDLSGDFRIDDPDIFKQYYALDHAGDLQSEFIYGLTESNRKEISGAQFIANPGCFATATSLALEPLVANGLIAGRIVVDAKTGSSGSGIKPAANTHHPQRANSFYAYKPFTHQHLPEIRQHLRAKGAVTDDFVFMTHSLPVSRGIFASCYVETKDAMSEGDLKALFSDHYKDAFFVRMVDGSPDINWVKNSNFCDISVHASGRHVVVFAAIDNLVKGAAGQAVQNMNLMYGLDEKTGLVFPGGNP